MIRLLIVCAVVSVVAFRLTIGLLNPVQHTAAHVATPKALVAPAALRAPRAAKAAPKAHDGLDRGNRHPAFKTPGVVYWNYDDAR